MLKRLAPWIVAFPWFWLCSLYATWLVAVVSLGRSPRPLLDDPELINGTVRGAHEASVALLVILLCLAFASATVSLALSLWNRLPWKASLTFSGASLTSWALAVLYGRIDPGRVMAWFLD